MELTQEQAKQVHNGKNRISFEELKGFDDLIKAIRLRFVTDSHCPTLDFSYLLIEVDGKEYKVDNVPFYQLNKKKWKSELYQIMKESDIYIKDLFDVVSIFKG